MGKPARIITFGLNNMRIWGTSQEEMLSIVMKKIDSVRGYKPDMICLPELFLEACGDNQNPKWEDISREALEKLQARAVELNCWIAASVYEKVPEHPQMRYITLYLIGRDGKIAAKYRKYHTVVEETTNAHALPGKEPYVVVDTDFGRIALLICFDIGWREQWIELGKRGVKLVVWASAYNGGRLLHTHAAHNMYYIVTSVQTDHPQIINMVGQTIAEGTKWDGFAMADVDLETTLFHTDRNKHKFDSIRAKLGGSVTLQTYSEENFFTLSCSDPEWPMERICEEFDMMPYTDYHEEATNFQIRTRELYPTD